MKRKPIIFFIFILAISILFILIQEDLSEKPTAAVMQKAFDSTGAKLVSSEIYLRARLAARSFDDISRQKQLLSDTIAGAGGDVEAVKPAFLSIDNDVSSGTETDYIINDTRSIHAGILNTRQDGSENEYELTVSLTDTAQNLYMEALVTGLVELLKGYGIRPAINICMIGSLDGKLKESELETVCANIFESAGANKVEGISDKGLVSVSAFSPSISDTVRVNGKRVNLNVAARYNSYEGKTYIWLATPIITTEY